MIKLEISEKVIRAKVIKEYLAGDMCFCFSCGNATKALQLAGVNVLSISPRDELTANRYIEPARAKQLFRCFDATSGNLPVFLIKEIAKEILEALPSEIFTNIDPIYIPTGSGETIFAFSYIFNINRLRAVIDEYNPAINFNIYSNLHNFIVNNFKVIDVNDFDLGGPGYLITQPKNMKGGE